MEGFLFAFYRFSQTKHAGMVQRMVHMLTQSDVIHVAVVPVWHCELDADGSKVHRALVGATAYTAFIDCGFEEQPAETLLEPEYDLVFMPVAHPERMRAGVAFLQSLRGAAYNYRSLPLTILPRAWKRHVPRWPNWLTHEQGLLLLPPPPASASPGSSSSSTAARPKTTTKKKRKQVFCSQMGLMLCYVCQTLPHYVADPAVCTPGELLQILREEEGCAVSCDGTRIRILPPPPPSPSAACIDGLT